MRLPSTYECKRVENGTLSARLRHEETQLQAPQERLPTEGVSGDFQLPDKELYEQLRAKARDVDTLTQREELAKGNFKMLKAYVCKFIDNINNRIQY